jgi:hypothetical protein
MPLGLTRLNERYAQLRQSTRRVCQLILGCYRKQRPNQNINFIKALDTPDREIAQDILERVSAIVWPIMKANYLLVNSLEEFPPNREFWVCHPVFICL